jgi:hypothetical protein
MTLNCDNLWFLMVIAVAVVRMEKCDLSPPRMRSLYQVCWYSCHSPIKYAPAHSLLAQSDSGPRPERSVLVRMTQYESCI